jgi:AcrR family transcriptional regulator
VTTTAASAKPAGDSEIARARREQIIVAAVEIITEQGLHNLSLSKLETRAGMKRGQLTYYFPTKEDILLAVFDRLLLLMLTKLHDGAIDCRRGLPSAWEMVQKLLRSVLSDRPHVSREFHALQHTFLAQIAHREDFRQKLAHQYAEWRNAMAAHWQVTGKSSAAFANKVQGKTVSSFVQALVHGLTVQLAADPGAFDRAEMLELCVGVLAPLFITPAGDQA